MFQKNELFKIWYKGTFEYLCLINFKLTFKVWDNIIENHVYKGTEGMSCRDCPSILYIYAQCKIFQHELVLLRPMHQTYFYGYMHVKLCCAFLKVTSLLICRSQQCIFVEKQRQEMKIFVPIKIVISNMFDMGPSVTDLKYFQVIGRQCTLTVSQILNVSQLEDPFWHIMKERL